MYTAGENCIFQENTIIGYRHCESCPPLVIGDTCFVRTGSVIYCDVKIGDNFQSGHHVIIREKTKIGNVVSIGTNTVIEGNVLIGNFVKISSSCCISKNSSIGNYVFLGPNVTLTNDRYPLKMRASYEAKGPVIEDGVSLGASVTVCPDIRIGHDSFIAAGSVVTKNIPPYSMVVGVPGKISPLPEKLRQRNMAISWMSY